MELERVNSSHHFPSLIISGFTGLLIKSLLSKKLTNYNLMSEMIHNFIFHL